MPSMRSKRVTACSLGTSANAAYQVSGHVLVMDASGGKMKDNISGGTFPVHTNTYDWTIHNPNDFKFSAVYDSLLV